MLRYKTRNIESRLRQTTPPTLSNSTLKTRDRVWDEQMHPKKEKLRREQEHEQLLLSQSPQFDEPQIVASICRDSFFEFVKEFWDVVVPEKPIWNWHIEYLCNELQKVAERVIAGKPKAYDLIINISPGTTKSTICSVMFPAWVWTRMPTARFICGSHAHELGLDLSRKSRQIVIENTRIDSKPSYFECFGVKLTEDQNTKGYFVNSAGGMRMSSTVGGKSPIGFHGHFLIVDDPLDPQAAVSELELKSANDWMNDTLPSRKIDKMVVPTILIMQRLHQNDPTGNRLAKGVKDLKHIRLPADCTQFVVAPKMLRDHYVDNLMDPVRMPRQFLNEELKLHGEYYVAGQYGQNPVPLGGAMFKVDCLTVDQAPLLSEFKWVYRYWDKAGTAGRGAYTVGCKMGVTFDDRFWILDIVRGQWEAAKRDRIIRNTAVKDGKNVIIAVEQEPGSGGKDSASATVRSLAGYKVVLDKPTSSDSSKELRAEPFSGQVNSYNVYVQKAHWNNDYIEELKFFPASTFKDQVDASSGAFNLLAVGRRRVGAL